MFKTSRTTKYYLEHIQRRHTIFRHIAWLVIGYAFHLLRYALVQALRKRRPFTIRSTSTFVRPAYPHDMLEIGVNPL